MKRRLLGGPAHGREVDTDDDLGFIEATGGHYSRWGAAADGTTRDFYWMECPVPWAVANNGDTPRLVAYRKQSTGDSNG